MEVKQFEMPPERESRGNLLKSQTEGRRSILQIRVDILKVIAEGYGKPTQVMYRANLSWNVLQNQLKFFLESAMVQVEEYGNRRRYSVTAKGNEMLQSYEKLVNDIMR